ncbi:CLCN7-like protein, partial [Mya arenaria]
MSHLTIVFRTLEQVWQIVDILKKEAHNGFPVVEDYDPNSDAEYTSEVHEFSKKIQTLKEKMDQLKSSDFRDAYPRFPPIQCAFLPRIFRLFRALGLRHVVVINDKNMVLGMVTRKCLARYNVMVNLLRGKIDIHEIYTAHPRKMYPDWRVTVSRCPGLIQERTSCDTAPPDSDGTELNGNVKKQSGQDGLVMSPPGSVEGAGKCGRLREVVLLKKALSEATIHRLLTQILKRGLTFRTDVLELNLRPHIQPHTLHQHTHNELHDSLVQVKIFQPFEQHSPVFLPNDSGPLLLAESRVVVNLLNLRLQLRDTALHIPVLLVQRAQPELIPEQCDSSKLLNKLFDITYHPREMTSLLGLRPPHVSVAAMVSMDRTSGDARIGHSVHCVFKIPSHTSIVSVNSFMISDLNIDSIDRSSMRIEACRTTEVYIPACSAMTITYILIRDNHSRHVFLFVRKNVRTACERIRSKEVLECLSRSARTLRSREKFELVEGLTLANSELSLGELWPLQPLRERLQGTRRGAAGALSRGHGCSVVHGGWAVQGRSVSGHLQHRLAGCTATSKRMSRALK